MTGLKRRPGTTNTEQLHQALAGAETFISEAGTSIIGAPAEKPVEAETPVKAAPKKAAAKKVASKKTTNAPEVVAEPEHKWPWDDIDDNVTKGATYTLRYRATIFKKIRFLVDNEPGGKSIQKICMKAIEEYVEREIPKYTKRPESPKK